MTVLAFGAKVTPEFRARVLRMAVRLACDPSHLMACMYFESKLNPKSINAVSGASGLINFIPSTAIGLGTTIEAIRAMTAMEQLDLVENYFAPYVGKLSTLSDTYMAVLWPRAVGAPEDYVLFEAPSTAYAQNRALDQDNDGKITKAEAASFVARALAVGLQPGNATEERELRPVTAPPTKGHTMGALAAAGLVGQLLQTVVSVFQPAARAKVEQAAEKITDPAGAKVLADSLMSVLQQVTGIADPIQATAAVTAPTPQAQAMLAKVETQTLVKLDELGSFLDQIAKMAIGLRQASDDSADRAAKRADTPNGWKLRMAQASFTQRTLALVIVCNPILLGFCAWCRSYFDVPSLDSIVAQLLIVEVAAIGMLTSTFRDQNGFSFGGTVDGNIAREGLDEVQARRAAQLGSMK